METPSSARRVTRSQTKAASWKIEDSTEKGFSKSRNQQDRSALIDITNDSPIVGLAMGSLKTPSSAIAKKTGNNNSQAARHTKTPGSGEALLRSHITTLLQKVEEETEVSKFSLEDRPFLHLKGFLHSPAGLIAPTPANTPHDLNLSSDESFKKSCLAAVTPSPVQEQLQISQVISELLDGKGQEKSSESCYVTRSLLQDFFSENSEASGGDSSSASCYSVLSFSGGIQKDKSPATEDDNSSVWSMQVNTSTGGDDDEDDEVITEEAVEEEEDYHLAVADYDYGEAWKEEEGVDALCEGISKMNVNGERRKAKFAGKHTRFVYNSDDELVEVEDSDVSPWPSEEEEEGFSGEEAEEEENVDGVLRLKGLPTPEGKHLRFPEGKF